MLLPSPGLPARPAAQSRLHGRFCAVVALALAIGQPAVDAQAQLQTPAPAQRPAAVQPPGTDSRAPVPPKGPSGQLLPRFVSLKSDRVNMRTGPGTEYPTQWVYRRAGLPVEVIGEFDSWRQVRDAEGATGWVLASLLSGRRTALVEPWELKSGEAKATAAAPQIALKADSRDGAGDVARIEAGVIANIRSCDGRWCAVAIGDFNGYLEQRRLWGVYKGETVR